MLENFLILFSLLPFYLIGAFPSGYLIARLSGIDISSVGSGNVGATNVARTLGKRAGLYTLVIDVLKGVLAVLIASSLSDQSYYHALVTVAVVSGHCFSIPGKLKGGKGVATTLGALIFFFPTVIPVALAVFITVFVFSRIVSVASVAAALSLPVVALFLSTSDSVFWALVYMALLITYRHRDNLKRLVEGREKRFSFSQPQGSQGQNMKTSHYPTEH
ncbi:MAG: glycerol-3-phosphate 1-O-acyltransferase [Candidatus Dadabacteria bacterium]|nr:MAG: glycerol-3-phosphate 1-O-acyltransferase [Candidatus Dadabacteria bacterium]